MTNHSNFNKTFILGITLVSAMGGLLFGYDWVVIGGAKPFYERFFDITGSPHLQGWAMSSALIGCLFGAMGSGFFTERYGRKIPLIVAATLFTVSAIAVVRFVSERRVPACYKKYKTGILSSSTNKDNSNHTDTGLAAFKKSLCGGNQ